MQYTNSVDDTNYDTPVASIKKDVMDAPGNDKADLPQHLKLPMLPFAIKSLIKAMPSPFSGTPTVRVFRWNS